VSETFGQRPFRGSIAVARGRVTKTELYGKAWRRILHDVYIDTAIPPTQRLRIQAAALRYPDGGIVTGRSAAYMWGATLGTLGDPVEMLTPKRSQSTADIRIRSGSIDPAEVVQRDGVRLPTPLHTAWDLARSLPVLDAVPWIDALAAACSLSTSDLLRHAAEHAGEWRSSNAPRTLELCDARAESAPESVVRVSLALHGVEPAPTPQFVVRRNGEFVARVGLAWEELQLALEYDGQRHADRNQIAQDRERMRRLNAAGWCVIHVTRNDLLDLDRLVAEIRGLIDLRRRVFVSEVDQLSDLYRSRG
jgi:hypothetical protein